jgi:hypothetical protein
MVAGPKKLREPATVVLLLVVVLRLVLAVLELVRSFQDLDRAGPSGLVPGDSVGGSAATVLFFSSTDALNLVVLALLVGGCVLWSTTPRARQLTLAALLVTAALVVVSAVDLVVLVLAGRGAPNVGEAALLALLALPVPVLALIALAQLRGSLSAARAERQREISAPPAEAAAPALGARAEPEAEPEHQPVWQPDQAAGAAWLTAGEAASGAAASRWGTPGDSGGWQPQPSGVAPSAPAAARPASTKTPQEPTAGPAEPPGSHRSDWRPGG